MMAILARRSFHHWLNPLLDWVGRSVLMAWVTLKTLGPWLRGRDAGLWTRTLRQAATLGFDSLLMTLIINLISGSVLALQTAEKFAMSGAERYVGGLVAIAVVREIAPVFTGLAVGAKGGTAIASELAHMQVTNQIASMRLLGIHPVRYLVLPRVLAATVMLPMLTLCSILMSNLGGMAVSRFVVHIHSAQYLESIWLTLTPRDIEISLLKATVFGALLSIISATVGLSTQGGAQEVGRATTRAAVLTAIAIIVLDFLLTWTFYGGLS